jgi:hypothetical protein
MADLIIDWTPYMATVWLLTRLGFISRQFLGIIGVLLSELMLRNQSLSLRHGVCGVLHGSNVLGH